MTETASHHWRTLCCRRQDPWFSASRMVRTSFRSSDQAHHCSLSEWISQLFLEAEHLFLSLLGADTETTASEAKTLQGAVYWVTALNPPMFIPLILQGLPYNKRSLSCHHLFVATFCARPLYKIDLCFSVCMRYLLSGVPYPFTTPFPFPFVSMEFTSVQFSHSVASDSLQPHGLQHARPPCPSSTPRAYSNSYPLCWWCHPTISSFCSFLLPPSVLPSIRVFSNESVLRIRWLKYWSFSFSMSFQWILRTDFL